jgi:hypothetical protein
LLLLLAALAPPQVSAAEGPQLTDLWDAPQDIENICDGRRTLAFICDLEIKECREGAVYFDSQADLIRDHDIQPICIFTGQPSDVRAAVLNLDLGVPVYIDRGGTVFGTILEFEMVPAMVLFKGNGSTMRTAYGGGESLAGILEAMMRAKSSAWLLMLVATPVILIAAILILVD